MEMLKSSSWMPWQRRMLAVLRYVELDKYIAYENVPGVAKERQPTEEIEAQKKWRERNARGSTDSTRIDLAMGDAEMILRVISGTMTVREILTS